MPHNYPLVDPENPGYSVHGKKLGRPRKETRGLIDTGEHWADAIIRLYSEGASDTEVCKVLKLPHKEFKRKEANEPLFAELVDFGRLAAKAWWIELGRKAAKNGAQSQAFQFWYANMKNQFGWSEKTETTDKSSTDNMSNDEIQSKISQLQRKIRNKPSNVEMKELLDD